MITKDLQNLYQTYLGEVPEEIVELPSSGSNRRYFRLTGTQKLIGVYGTSKEENEAFLYMAAHFRKKGLPVPEVYICSEDKNCYLQEDLGDILLFNAIEKGGRPASSPKRRKKCCARPSAYCLPSNLPEQTALIFTLLSPSRIQPTFYPWDLNYFKYCF